MAYIGVNKQWLAEYDDTVRKDERVKALDIILENLSHRSHVGRSLEIIAEERGENWLRDELLEVLARQDKVKK